MWQVLTLWVVIRIDCTFLLNKVRIDLLEWRIALMSGNSFLLNSVNSITNSLAFLLTKVITFMTRLLWLLNWVIFFMIRLWWILLLLWRVLKVIWVSLKGGDCYSVGSFYFFIMLIRVSTPMSEENFTLLRFLVLDILNTLSLTCCLDNIGLLLPSLRTILLVGRNRIGISNFIDLDI
jgi:hypothetical protein